MSTPTNVQTTLNGVQYYWAHLFTLILSSMLSAMLVSAILLNADKELFAITFVVTGLFSLFGGVPSSLLIEYCLNKNNVWTYAAKAVLYPAAGILVVYLFLLIAGGPIRFPFHDHQVSVLLIVPALLQSWTYYAVYSIICLLMRRSMRRRVSVEGEDEFGTDSHE